MSRAWDKQVPDEDSNSGPPDYQSGAALPELQITRGELGHILA